MGEYFETAVEILGLINTEISSKPEMHQTE
jgi:hypothetical protein